MKNGNKGRDRFWQAHLSAWQRSGLTQKEYCRRQGLAAWSFSTWKRRLTGKDEQRSAGGFVPVVTRRMPYEMVDAVSEVGRSPLTLVVADRYRIEIGENFSGETLRRLLALLGDR